MPAPAPFKTASLTMRFPADIIERVKRHSARVLMRHTVWVQNAVTRELLVAEREWEERNQKKPKKAKDKDKNPFGPTNPSPLPPPPQSVYVDETPRIQREMEKIFAEQSQRIMKVLDKPVEKRLLIVETISKIKRAAPLTHPSEGVILSTLEEMVGALIDDNKKVAPAPTKEEIVIDPTSVDTVGDDE